MAETRTHSHAHGSTGGHAGGGGDQQPDEQMLVCIQNCQDCSRACTQTLAYCMRQGGPHSEDQHLRLMIDCADICHTSANFMLRGSDLHAVVCGACAEVCQRCADDCDRMATDLRMKALADTCRHCAESCRQMATTAAAAVTVPRGPQRTGPVMSRKKTE